MTLSFDDQNRSFAFGAVVESSAGRPDPGRGWRVDGEAEAAIDPANRSGLSRRRSADRWRRNRTAGHALACEDRAACRGSRHSMPMAIIEGLSGLPAPGLQSRGMELIAYDQRGFGETGQPWNLAGRGYAHPGLWRRGRRCRRDLSGHADLCPGREHGCRRLPLQGSPAATYPGWTS